MSIDVGWVGAVDGRVVSVDGGMRVSIDERVLLSIDAVHFPLRFERSKCARSKKSSVCFLLLLVLLGLHLKRQENFFISFCK